MTTNNLPPAQILDLARRCGVKATEAALIEFAALVRAAEPLAPEEMRPAPLPQPVEAAAKAAPIAWMKPGEIAGLLKAAREDGGPRRYGRIYARQYDLDMVPVCAEPAVGSALVASDDDWQIKLVIENGSVVAPLCLFRVWPLGDGTHYLRAAPTGALVAAKGVTLRAFKGHDTEAWHVVVEHPFGTSWVKMGNDRDAKLAELLAAPADALVATVEVSPSIVDAAMRAYRAKYPGQDGTNFPAFLAGFAESAAAPADVTDVQILSAFWEQTGRDWVVDETEFAKRDQRFGYFFDYGQLIDAVRALLSTPQPTTQAEGK